MSNRKTLIKFTDTNAKTRNGMQWGEGVTHTASGKGELCGPGWIHVYEGLGVAMLMAPIHVPGYTRVWRAQGTVDIRDGQVKCGTRSLTTIEEVDVVPPTVEERVTVAIVAAMEVLTPVECPKWFDWAEAWLSGEDRSAAAAAAAYAAAYDYAAAAADAAYAAAYDYAAAAAYAADVATAAAADAAYAAADAATDSLDLDGLACAVFGYDEEETSE